MLSAVISRIVTNIVRAKDRVKGVSGRHLTAIPSAREKSQDVRFGVRETHTAVHAKVRAQNERLADEEEPGHDADANNNPEIDCSLPRHSSYNQPEESQE
jgi:hypothetical protein